MRDTDVRIEHAETAFRDITLARPLTLSGGAITDITLALVSLTVTNRGGATATGQGASVLSVPWSWPASALSVAQRDAVLRQLTERLAAGCVADEPADPFGGWSRLTAAAEVLRCHLSARLADEETIPHLAGMLALGAVDNALHDAWARAAQLPAYSMYGSDYLNDDLSQLLGPEFTGRYPGDDLREPLRELPIQHVLSPSDPLAPAEAHSDSYPSTEWLEQDGPRHLKIKLGHDPTMDADRVIAIYEVFQQHRGGEPHLSIDPNEAYASPAEVIEMLDTIERRSPAAAAAIAYVEQPIPRGSSVTAAELRHLGRRLPVIIDEGLFGLTELRSLSSSGWSGLVIKASKGQTFSLLAHSYARAYGLYTTMQDLTAADLALWHSARLASFLANTGPHFECNSRQYAPHANQRLRRDQPGLVDAAAGHAYLPPSNAPGIY